MPALSDHASDEYTKILYIGDSSTGKTGSLVSLVKDGYRLRVLDLDNGLEPLKVMVRHHCPDKIGNVDYVTARDQFKASSMGPILLGAPKAFSQSLAFLDKWEDGSSPKEWGAETFLVIDSLTALGRAAYFWAQGMNPTAKEQRTWYFAAQQAIETAISMVTADTFHTNVIIISHIDYRKTPTGIDKGYVNAIGRALGPVLPKYFNTLILAEASGQGKNVRRRIKTLPTGVVDLKTPNPFKLEAELPLETGLSTIVKALKGK